MVAMKDIFQSADFKSEKHVPVIEAEDKVKRGETIKVSVTVGKEIPHPKPSEHHISWIELYFLPKSEKFPYQVARLEFNAHGASTQGPNTSSVYTAATAEINFKTDKPGTIIVSSYCNIHGLWENFKEINVE
jgi:superoxide reductase